MSIANRVKGTLITTTLFSETGILLITTGSGYVFSYLNLLVVGRLLGPAAFGVLGALFAVFYFASLVGQGITEAIATRIAEIDVKTGRPAAILAFKAIGMKIAGFCLIPSVILVIIAKPFSAYFHLASIVPVIILAVSLVTTLFLDIILGLFQGLRRFKALGVTGYSVSLGLKTVFGLLFVWIGWGISGAVASLLVSTTVAGTVGLLILRKDLANNETKASTSNGQLPAAVLTTAIILAIFMAMPTSVDVMLVSHFIGGVDAGLYNAVATIGKVVIFLPMAVSFVLLPKATEYHTLRRGTKKLLLQSLLLVLILSGGVVTICWMFPEFLMVLFFGKNYGGGGHFIGLYVTAMLLFSLDFVLVHYSLGIRKLSLIVFADVVTLGEVIGILLLHQTILQVVWVLFFGNLLIILVGLPYLVLRKTADTRAISH